MCLLLKKICADYRMQIKDLILKNFIKLIKYSIINILCIYVYKCTHIHVFK